MRAVAVGLLVLVSALSGCFDGLSSGDGDGDSSSSSSSSSGSSSTSRSSSSSSSSTSTGVSSILTSSSSTSTSIAPSPPGQPPSSSTMTQSQAPKPRTAEDNTLPTGTITAKESALLTFEFKLTGHDADGDALEWALLFGDGGFTGDVVLPATVTHTYPAGGLYTVKYHLSDRWGTTVSTLVANVTGNAAAPPAAFTSFTVTAANVASCTACTFAEDPIASVGFQAAASGEDSNGLDSLWTELPGNAVGQPFSVIADNPDGPDSGYFIMTTCSPDTYVILAFADGAGNESGKIPEGAGCLFGFAFGGPAPNLTLTVG